MNNSIKASLAITLSFLVLSSNQVSAMGTSAMENVASYYESVDYLEFNRLSRKADKNDVAMIRSFGSKGLFEHEYASCGGMESDEIESAINGVMWETFIEGDYSRNNIVSKLSDKGTCVIEAYESDIAYLKKISDAADRILDAKPKMSEDMKFLLEMLSLLKYRLS